MIGWVFLTECAPHRPFELVKSPEVREVDPASQAPFASFVPKAGRRDDPSPIDGATSGRFEERTGSAEGFDLSSVVKNRVVTEDQVAAEIGFTGTNSGPLQMAPGAPAMPATGKKVTGQGTYFIRIRNGKAVEIHTYPDAAGLMMQLGMMPGG